MAEITSAFTHYWFAFLIIFIILFSAFIKLLSNQNSISSIYLGFGKIIVSILSSPFYYIRNSLSEIADIKSNDSDHLNKNQYLLNKLGTILGAIIVVIAVAILVTGSIIGWQAMQPDAEYKTIISELKKDVDSMSSKIDSSNEKRKNYDAEWNSKKGELIKQLEVKLSRARVENQSLKNELTKGLFTNSVFSQVDSYLSGSNQKNQPQKAKNEAYGFIDSKILVLGGNSSAKLKKYVDNWYILSTNNKSEDEMRRSMQPDYESISNAELSKSLDYKKKELAKYQKMASYKFKAFFVSLFTSILTFIIFIWCGGLLKESIMLFVDMATNVHKIENKIREKE